MPQTDGDGSPDPPLTRLTRRMPALAPDAGPAPSPTARWLGLAGLLPFVVGAMALWAVGAEHRAPLALALHAYAAVIVSFLGGIHWGIAARHGGSADALLWWGVTPSLVAWIALLLPQAWGLPMLVIALLACYLVDARTYPRAGMAS